MKKVECGDCENLVEVWDGFDEENDICLCKKHLKEIMEQVNVEDTLEEDS